MENGKWTTGKWKTDIDLRRRPVFHFPFSIFHFQLPFSPPMPARPDDNRLAAAARGAARRLAGEAWLQFALFATLLAYLPSLRGEFVWDDHNLFLMKWAEPGATPADFLFRYDNRLLDDAFFRPWLTFVQYLLVRGFGRSPFAFRAAGLAVHLAAVGAAWFLFRRVAGDADSPEVRRRAAIGALLFGLWPTGADAIGWVSNAGDLHATFFLTVAVVLHLRARDRGRSALPSALFFFLALCSKETAIVFPALAAAATALVPAAVRLGPRAWFASALWLPHLLAYLAHAAWRRAVLHGDGSIAGQASQMLGHQTPMAVVRAAGFLVRELLLLGDAPPYVESAPDGAGPLALLAAALLATAGIVVASTRRREARPWLFPAVWFWIGIAPFVASTGLTRSITAVSLRYLYLPSLCVGIAATLFLSRLRALPVRVLLPVAAVLSLLLGTSVQRRLAPWLDDFALWSRASADLPRSLLARLNLGLAQERRGDLDGALDSLRIAAYLGEARDPNLRKTALVRLAEHYADRGDRSRAAGTLAAASHLPGTRQYAARAIVLSRTLALQETIRRARGPDGRLAVPRATLRKLAADLERAVQLQPDSVHATAHVALATLEELLDEPVRARERYRQAARNVARDPAKSAWARAQAERLDRRIVEETDPVRRHYHAAQERELAGDPRGAATAYEAALALAPTRVDLLNGLADARAAAGDARGAAAALERAIRERPDDAILWFNLGRHRMTLGEVDSALTAFERARVAEPGWDKPAINAAMALERLGRPDEAIVRYEAFLAAFEGEYETRTLVEARLADLRARTRPSP